MRFRVLHQTSRRMRIQIDGRPMTVRDADKLEYYLNASTGITRARVNERTNHAVLFYQTDSPAIWALLDRFDFDRTAIDVPERTGRELTRTYEDRAFFLIARRVLTRLLLPQPLSMLYTILCASRHICEGLDSLLHGRLDVSVLDAASISISLVSGDLRTAGSITCLLDGGQLLEEWTHKRCVDDLAQRLYLNTDRAWKKTGSREILTPLDQIAIGDEIVVRIGNIIPLDGTITDGMAEINQTSLTGEPLAVMRTTGAAVYAGTVLESGECTIRVSKPLGSGRYDRIIQMIEASEQLKSGTEQRTYAWADGLVPISLTATLLLYLLTANPAKALSILMVDFSCALKLAIPISVVSAMRECGEHRITVKGGKALEAIAHADTLIFDKTGTLTYAEPHVKSVTAFGTHSPEDILALAACLEEQFPHPVARAIVAEARKKGLDCDIEHSEVQYVVAHGIVSSVHGKRVCIGSRHFIFDDEKVRTDGEDLLRLHALPEDTSRLYLSIDGTLCGVICIDDPLRPEAAQVIHLLKEEGLHHIVMLTGDSWQTSAIIAKQAGIPRWHSEVLPEDKAHFIQEERANGRIVAMVGDGINDSPALSEADIGIAVASGAAIAREVADIVISADDLYSLVDLRRISDALQLRIRKNYKRIIGSNSLLILLGVLGILPPTATSLLHNLSTVCFGLGSTTRLLPDTADGISGLSNRKIVKTDNEENKERR